MAKHFLKLLGMTKDEMMSYIDLGIKLKAEHKAGIKHNCLSGKSVGLIFQKSSTRTRVSFEVGVTQLGGYPLFLSANDLQIGRGEPVQDTARVLSRYLDGIMIRTFEQKEVEDLAKFGSIPVINGLTDLEHPCQILADFMTIKEYKGDLSKLSVCFIGDGNNMSNSLIAGGLAVGMSVTIACPVGYEPDKDILEFAKRFGDKFKLVRNPMEAASGCDVVFTDVWASMGQEGEAEIRKKAFEGFIVDEKLMSQTKSDAIVMHCLPAHRGEEISEDVFEAHANEIFDEAENRLHIQKAIMAKLIGNM